MEHSRSFLTENGSANADPLSAAKEEIEKEEDVTAITIAHRLETAVTHADKAQAKEPILSHWKRFGFLAASVLERVTRARKRSAYSKEVRPEKDADLATSKKVLT